MSEKEETLLKKKREKEDDDDSSESSSSDDGKPVKSIFGNSNETGFKGGLFGDLTKPSQPQSLFGSGSLFSNTKGSSLFDNKGESLFSKNSSLFNFSEINKKKDSEDEEEEGNDNIGKSDSPNPYNPEEDKDKEKEGFKKIYVKKIDNFYMFDKEEKKYKSKGEGFVS